MKTASDLMAAVFGHGLRPTERPCIARQLDDGRQPADPWPETPQQGHTHVSVGLFEWNTPRVARDGFKRRFDHCTGVKMLLLDDIHEKVAPPDVDPTIKIETKPGSEQWLYVFDEPLRDLTLAAQMMETLAEAGHADPGGSVGKTAAIRLGRLPGSDPKERGFKARIIWHDMRRLFKPEAARLFGPKGFNLPLVKPRRLTTTEAAVTLLNPATDPLLNWLNLNGHVRGQQSAQGWVPITCPWVHTHSDQAPTGTDYLVARPRGFHCFHTHCQSRKPVDFLIWAAQNGAPFDARPRTGQSDIQLAWRLEDGTLPVEIWNQRDHEKGRITLAWKLAALAMQEADIRDVLRDHCGVGSPVADAISGHVRSWFEQECAKHEELHEMGERINSTLDRSETSGQTERREQIGLIGSLNS